MSCGCTSRLKDGIEVVDHVKSKGKENFAPAVAHEIMRLLHVAPMITRILSRLELNTPKHKNNSFKDEQIPVI